jgi:ATP phosphoribosyltransferase
MLSEFRSAELKISIPKGELQEFCLGEFRRLTGAPIPAFDEVNGKLGYISPDRGLAVEYSRNRDCVKAVARGFTDLTIAGSDQLGDFAENDIQLLRRYTTPTPWKMVVAVPEDSTFTELAQLSSLATQYRALSQRYLKQRDLERIVIEETTGGTEMKPYSWGVDGIIEVTVSGTANNLRIIETLDMVEPLLIANNVFMESQTGQNFCRRLNL